VRGFRSETWAYAVLLLLLFATASLAVVQTMHFLDDRLSPDMARATSAALWALTLGFMSIAGAFGLWGIRMAAEAEGRRRVGKFVTELDHLRDAILTADRSGRVTGFNAATRSFATLPDVPGTVRLGDVFPCLTHADCELLARPADPVELERPCEFGGQKRTLRFRAQQSEGLSVVMISDITMMNRARLRNRQVARLQLLEQMANGVAHDFSKLLFSIAGHASLLARLPAGSEESASSIRAIDQSARHGSMVTARLLGLIRPSVSWQPTIDVRDPLEMAAAVLRDTLSRGWTVETSVESVPPVGMPRAQLEQVVLNLGLLAADANHVPGTVTISAATDPELGLERRGDYAGAVVIRSQGGDAERRNTGEEVHDQSPGSEPGIIQSVLESAVAECGGRLDSLQGRDRSPVYVVWMPAADPSSLTEDRSELPQELAAYASHWHVLMATSRQHAGLRERMELLGMKVERAGEIASSLAFMESEPALDGAVFDIGMLQHGAAGIVRALIKLSPGTGFVVCGEPEGDLAALISDVVFTPEFASPDRIILAMMEARALSLRRTRQ